MGHDRSGELNSRSTELDTASTCYGTRDLQIGIRLNVEAGRKLVVAELPNIVAASSQPDDATQRLSGCSRQPGVIVGRVRSGRKCCPREVDFQKSIGRQSLGNGFISSTPAKC